MNIQKSSEKHSDRMPNNLPRNFAPSILLVIHTVKYFTYIKIDVHTVNSTTMLPIPMLRRLVDFKFCNGFP